jgi:hypothetical protein
MALDFESQYKSWLSCPPSDLFEAPVREFVEDVRNIYPFSSVLKDLVTGILDHAARLTLCIGQEANSAKH